MIVPEVRAADAFPGMESLVPNVRGESVLARLRGGREIAGRLVGFFSVEQRVEIAREDGTLERAEFADLQWMKFTRAVDPALSATALRDKGFPVETLPRRSPFSLAFANGQVLCAELYGYGAALGGLGLYLAEDGGRATRMFVPVCAIEEFTVGERLGTLMLERAQLSAEGLEIALERQRMLRHQRLGGLLLEHRLVTRGELEKALAVHAAQPVQPLGQVMVQMGMLTEVQLATALAAQQADRRKPLGQILLELGLVDGETLHAVLAEKLGIPYVDLKRYPFEASWGDLAPYPVCRDNKTIPLYRSGGSVIAATDDPLDVGRLAAVSFALGGQVIPVLASPEDIAWTLERHPERRLYEALEQANPGVAGQEEGENAEALASRLGREFAGTGELLVERHVEPGDSTLVRLVNKIISDAYHQKASDIHFEPGNGRERLRVRLRRDGALFDYLTLSARFRPAVVSRIKIMANLDISEHRHSQDGKIDFRRFGGLPLELRVACIPTLHGLESIVLRLLGTVAPLPLAKIGLAPHDLSRLEGMAGKPYGLILVCGPTGSGKTTTLHSLLMQLNTPDTKIWTAEDPIEITQAGLNQVQMQAGIGWNFAAALRAFLRADPDVIMIGEIRDAETARIAVEASLTGHLVLSTLHTNSAPESVVRLVDIGIDPFNFTDALLGVLAQRLTRRLCARCARSEPLADAALTALAEEYCHGSAPKPPEVIARWRQAYGGDGLRVIRPVGCKACSGTGYAGRLALFELLAASPGVKRLMLRQGTVEQIRALGMEEGMRTLKQDGIEKVLQGLTTIEQVRAVAG